MKTETVDEEQPPEENQRRTIFYVRKPLSRAAKKRLKYVGIFLLALIILGFLLVFVGFPLIFMNSIALQRILIFTNWNLPSKSSYFEKHELLAGLRNFYVSVHDLNSEKIISLGVWHLLPYIYEEEIITEPQFDFESALKSNFRNVLLYFHGTGEDRSSSFGKYKKFREAFHVITFDYRSYADSAKAELSEDAVVNDCLQLYEWLLTKTNASIFFWGHSLGTALATRTAAIIRSKNITQPIGLVLEAPFTKMSEELYVHPYGKIFAWLPYFKATVIEPLQKNGFIFDTSKHILSVNVPIMILSAEDDNVVPYTFGRELYEIAKNNRTGVKTTFYYQFAYNLGYNHNFMYQNYFFPYFINYFHYICVTLSTNTTDVAT